MAPDVKLEEIQRRMLAAADPAEKRRWHVVLLSRQGRSVQYIADESGLTLQGVRKIIRRFNELGPAGMPRQKPVKRVKGRRLGRPQLLDEDKQVELRDLLKEPVAPNGDLWSPAILVSWSRSAWHLDIHEATARRYLDKLRPSWSKRRRKQLALEREKEKQRAAQPSLFD
jgi:transposase